MSRQQYILNRLPIGLVMLDRECRVQSFSGTAAAIFGAERLCESVGKTIQSLHPGHSRSKTDWLLHQSQNEDASACASMLINVPNTILQLRMARLHDADGISGYCLIMYDITELTHRPTKGEPAGGENSVEHVKFVISMAGKAEEKVPACMTADQRRKLSRWILGHRTRPKPNSTGDCAGTRPKP